MKKIRILKTDAEYAERYMEIEKKYGEDLADAISMAIDLFENPADPNWPVNKFRLAAAFADDAIPGGKK
jgi:hypothetical protein